MDRAELLDIIMDHYENPRNFGELEGADISLQGGNPGCGDIVTVYLKFYDGKIKEIKYTGEGCTISQAAASMLTELAPGWTISQIEELDYHFIEDLIGEELVKTRPKCATVALDTLKIATLEYFRQNR